MQGETRERRSIEEIERELAVVSAHIDAAEHRRLSLIRELIELDVSLGDDLSVAQWLSWRIGLSPGAARERVRVAMALGSLPRIDQALMRGELSYSKVRAMTRIATPDNEEKLLDQALVATAAQLERICRGVRRVQREGNLPVAEEADRWVLSRPTDDGMVIIEAKLLPDEAAAVMKALDAAQRSALERQQAEERRCERVSAETSVATPAAAATSESRATGARGVSAETSEAVPPERRRPPQRPGRADALVEVAAQYLGSAGGRSPTVAERNQVIVAITPSTLMDDAYQATLDDGTRVSAETLRRIACDAGLVPALASKGGTPLDVGRRTRTVPPPIRRALEMRDGGCCQHPGCTNRYWLEAHHAESWLDGGETSLANLLLLCRKHHRLLHEGGARVEVAATGELVFYDWLGRTIEPAPRPPPLPPGAVNLLVRRHAEAGIHIDDQTGLCGWDGSQPDYAMCVDALRPRLSA